MLLAVLPAHAFAHDDDPPLGSVPVADTPAPPRGAELWLPLGSVIVPGLGQYAQGATRAGLAYTGASAGGYATFLLVGSNLSLDDLDDISARDELGAWAVQLGQDAGLLSAYDSFHRSLPALQAQGKYTFLARHDSTAALLKAPFEVSFLKRKSSYIPAALVLAAVVAARAVGPGEGREFAPVHPHDGLFALGLSYNAGVAEEALFRGYMMPVFRQHLGQRALPANALQSAFFAAAHGTLDPARLGFLFVSGLYDGHLVNRNKGSVRQTVFNHFVWDVLAVTGTLLTRERDRPAVYRAITIRF